MIAVANEAFAHKHPTSFTPREFGELVDSTQPQSAKVFGNYGALVDEIHLSIDQKEQQLNCSPPEGLAQITKLLTQENIEHQPSQDRIHLHGVSIYIGENPPSLNAVIDSHVAEFAFPLLEKAIRPMRPGGVSGLTFRIDFVDSVRCIEEQHKKTGRVVGTDVKLGTGNDLIRGNLQFYLGRMMRFFGIGNTQRGPTYVTIKLLTDAIPLEEVRELIAVLFDRGVLYLESGFPYEEF